MQIKLRSMGARLRLARTSVDLTAKELGKTIGRSERTIFRYEWGATEPTLEEIRKLAARCKVSVGWLVNGEGEPHRATAEAR
jgi:transcriptional regulator with XRE-family HTH domain